MSKPSEQDRDIVIRPSRPWWQLDLREFWHYRDLIVLMTRRDITAQYKQTLLGPVWHVIQPLITTFTFALIFGRAAGLAPKGVPSILFYMSGIVAWSFFAGVVNRTSRTFVTNAQVMSKVYFPRLVVPVSTTLSSLVSFAIQFGLFVVFVAVYHFTGRYTFTPNASLLLLPVLVLLMAMLGLGAGILVSALTIKYRDVSFLVGFGIQLLMYASPVILPLRIIANYKVLLALFWSNPMTPVIEAMRAMFLGHALPWNGLLYTAVFSVVILVAGVSVFHRVERSFSDIV